MIEIGVEAETIRSCCLMADHITDYNYNYLATKK